MSNKPSVVMQGVAEHGEGMGVFLSEVKGRITVQAFNEAGCNYTQVDLLQLLQWVRTNRPDLMAGGVEGNEVAK